MRKCEVVAERQELDKNAIDVWPAQESALSVSTAVKDFSLDKNAVYPLCSKSRPECGSDTYSTAPVYGDVAGFQTKVAVRMGKPCFECSLSFQMSFVLQIQESLKSQHPARACFGKHPSPLLIQEAESFL